jgi:hypothetical protein
VVWNFFALQGESPEGVGVNQKKVKEEGERIVFKV